MKLRRLLYLATLPDLTHSSLTQLIVKAKVGVIGTFGMKQVSERTFKRKILVTQLRLVLIRERPSVGSI